MGGLALGEEEDREEVSTCLEEEVGLAEEEDGEEVGLAVVLDGGPIGLLTSIPMEYPIVQGLIIAHPMGLTPMVPGLTLHPMVIPTTRGEYQGKEVI